MKPLPTAESIMLAHIPNGVINLPSYRVERETIIRAMIDIAQIAVTAALEAAAENAELSYNEDTDSPYVDKHSIINAYPLTNIK